MKKPNSRPAALVFPDDMRPDFTGFTPAAFRYLRGLARNNEKAWFDANRETYEREVKFPMECLVASFPRDSGLPVWGNPKRSLFRIHRDVRFSPNKQPYKVHAGAVLTRDGGRGTSGMVYIHIQPGGCFVSSGFYMPDPAVLTAWRRRMVEKPAEFLAVARALSHKGAPYSFLTRESLKTLPQGFREHAESPVAEYLKWKHFLVHRPVSDAEASGPGLVDIVRKLAKTATPLLDYGWAVMEWVEPRRS